MTLHKKPCSRCGKPQDRKGQRYCRLCHNAYQRETRPKYFELSKRDRFRSGARAYANVYKGRGKLVQQPCEVCASKVNIQMHHENYSKPLEVNWLCVECHTDLHI